MYQSTSARELMIGVVRDPVFGPAISFGLGGTMVEILRDKAVALPPLNEYMVEQMIAKTKAARYLKAFRQLPPANKKAIVAVLLNISNLVSELPEILELDINPLIADEKGVMAVDARIKAKTVHQLIPYSHMTIHPYPSELIQQLQLSNGMEIVLRPIRPEDAKMEKEFMRSLSERTKYFRFMQALQELTPEMIVRFTQIDYDREMAFVAVTTEENDGIELGVARYIINPDGLSAEFALVVADQYQGLGIGSRLMNALMLTAKNKGIISLEGEVLSINQSMLALVKKLSFSIESINDDPEIVRVIKNLRL
jgi:acetyltransferase